MHTGIPRHSDKLELILDQAWDELISDQARDELIDELTKEIRITVGRFLIFYFTSNNLGKNKEACASDHLIDLCKFLLTQDSVIQKIVMRFNRPELEVINSIKLFINHPPNTESIPSRTNLALFIQNHRGDHPLPSLKDIANEIKSNPTLYSS